MKIVTTSWDDGYPADMRVAEMLYARQLKGTFYVPKAGPDGKPTLRAGEVRSLCQAGFDIGAHTLTHCDLTKVSPQQMKSEINGSKWFVQNLCGADVNAFCYPRGRFNARVRACVREAGFRGARTTRMLATQPCFDPFEMPTALQAFPTPPVSYLKNCAKRRQWTSMYRYVTQWCRSAHWVKLGRKLFDEVLESRGIWHLYGHSWEIEALDLWTELGELLDYVAHRPGVIYESNSGLLDMTHAGRELEA